MTTIVLVGGSFLGAWAWERVTPLLREAGHDVHALTLTGFGDREHLGSAETTLSTHTLDIVAAIEVAGLRDVVLVAHSYAGAPATLAAARIPSRIARLVLIAALLPQPGRTLFEIAPPGAEEAIMASVVDGRIPVLSDEVLDTYYGEHGLTAEGRAWLRERGVGHPLGTYREPAPGFSVDTIPQTFVACAGDPGEPPAGAIVIDTGHWPMITKPVELAELIGKVAT